MQRSLSTWQRVLIVVAALVLLAVIAGLTDGPDPAGTTIVDRAAPGQGASQRELAPIDVAELLISPNGDGVVVVHILVGLPSGCHSFDGYDIALADASTGRVAIEVWNRLPMSDEPLVCTAIYGMHDLVIELASELDGRVRSVVINGEVTLDLDEGPTSYRR